MKDLKNVQLPWEEEDAKIIREMIFKENEWMNYRVTWLVTLQGLLFAALSFAWKDGKELVPILGGVGVFASFAALPPLYFAHHSIKLLRDSWDAKKVLNYNGPPVIGHCHEDKKPWFIRFWDGFLSFMSLWWILPILFIGAWGLVLYISYGKHLFSCILLTY